MPLAKPYPESEYCTHITTDGRRCRALKMMTREVCLAHWKKDGDFIDDEEALAQLASRWAAMTTSRGINRALAYLFHLTALGKVSHRRAALLTYQAQLMLYSMDRKRVHADPTSDAIAADLAPQDSPAPGMTQASAAAHAAFSRHLVDAMEEVMEPVAAGIKSQLNPNGNGNANGNANANANGSGNRSGNSSNSA